MSRARRWTVSLWRASDARPRPRRRGGSRGRYSPSAGPAASVTVMRELGIPYEKFNVNGGAVALGHPIGCSGARVLTTLAYAMKDRGAKRGLATLCLGGGNAVSMIIERP